VERTTMLNDVSILPLTKIVCTVRCTSLNQRSHG